MHISKVILERSPVTTMGTKQKILYIDRRWWEKFRLQKNVSGLGIARFYLKCLKTQTHTSQDIHRQVLIWVIFAVFLRVTFDCSLYFYYFQSASLPLLGPSVVFNQFSKQCKSVGDFWCLLHPDPEDQVPSLRSPTRGSLGWRLHALIASVRVLSWYFGFLPQFKDIQCI